MPERRAPLRVLDRLDPPDLWPDIRGREPRDLPSPARGRRVAAAAVAFAVATAGVVLAIRAFSGPSEPPGPAVTDTVGRIAFEWYDGTSYQIYSANADRTDITQLTDVPISVSQPTWSPDTTKIAFQGETAPGEGGRLDIYVANADGTGVTQLTHGPDSYQHPSWSPDGTTIAATRWSNGHGDIVLLPTDGSAETVVTSGRAGDSWGPVWSPDGKRITLVSNRDANGELNDEIWVMNADGSDPVDLTNSPAYDRDPTWSPDATRIAFFTGPEGSPDLEVMNADGSDPRTLVPSVEDGGEPSWSPDGREIAFIEDDYRLGRGRLQIVDVASGEVTEPLDLVGVGSPAWQPVDVSEPTPTPTATPSESIEPTITASASDVIPIEENPGAVSAVAYGFDSVWVASFDGSQQGWLTRLDARTGETLARISTANVFPTWEVGGGDLATGFGSVWMAGASSAPGEPSGVHAYLLRIDPTTAEVVATIDLRASDPADVAIDDTGVWVMSFGLGERPTMEVSRIDPSTNDVVATIPLDSWYGHHLFSVGGWIVASTNAGTPDKNGAIPDGVLNVLDPQSDTEARTIPVGPSAWPGAGAGQLWIATGDSLRRIDPSSGLVLERYEVPNTGDALAVGEGGVWFIDPEGRSTIDRFDAGVGSVDLSVHLPDGTTPIAMITSPGVVWVLNYEGSLTRIDLS
jgi:TolB protein